MSTHIPDLWPKELSVTVLSPKAILTAQAVKLAERTNGLLEAKVASHDEFPAEGHRIYHDLEIIAPVLGYTHGVLSAWHLADLFYPVFIKSKYRSSEGVASTEEKFVEEVGKVLQSPELLSVLQSLIARSNEAEQTKQAG